MGLVGLQVDVAHRHIGAAGDEQRAAQSSAATAAAASNIQLAAIPCVASSAALGLGVGDGEIVDDYCAELDEQAAILVIARQREVATVDGHVFLHGGQVCAQGDVRGEGDGVVFLGATDGVPERRLVFDNPVSLDSSRRKRC
ncbi:hypothetical protein LB545_30715 [Mesorhizobium sp. BR1-1-6]|nr:hypothetical protein [Mesorhizobium sp. BR1-1-6]